MEAPRGAREPTGTNGPTLNKHPHKTRVKQQRSTTLPQPLYKSRSTHTPPTPHNGTQKPGGMVLNTSLVVVIAPGKRPATFRTWKLSPAAPMVLQPTGCGRVGHRHNTLQASGQEPNGSWPLRYPTQQKPPLTTDTHKTTPNKHTSLSGKSAIEYEPHQGAWTNNYRINKASTTCHNPSTPSLNPSTPHSTRPSPQRV